MTIPKKEQPNMLEDTHKVTKSYSLFGYYAKSEEELAIASTVLLQMLELIQSQGIDLHFRRIPGVQKDFDYDNEKIRYSLTMRVALLPSDTGIGIRYDHSHGPVQINLNDNSEKETA